MNHGELRTDWPPRVDGSTLPYLFARAADGEASAAAVSLIPHPDGTVTATFGGLRQANASGGAIRRRASQLRRREAGR
jgi:hypothetical protein